jgi:hypothetical protein
MYAVPICMCIIKCNEVTYLEIQDKILCVCTLLTDFIFTMLAVYCAVSHIFGRMVKASYYFDNNISH